jgi:DNA anti-recombination protein RmuC
MTKVYEALKMAEAQRSSGNAAEPGATVRLATHDPGAGELERIRAILIGNLPEILEEALDRLSAMITAQSASFRSELDGLEQKLDKRIAEIEARSSHGRNELRDQILSQSKLLTDSIQERSEHAVQVSTRSVKELSEAKLDRGDFAEFLRHTAEHFARRAAGGDDGEGRSETNAVA